MLYIHNICYFKQMFEFANICYSYIINVLYRCSCVSRCARLPANTYMEPPSQHTGRPDINMYDVVRV